MHASDYVVLFGSGICWLMAVVCSLSFAGFRESAVRHRAPGIKPFNAAHSLNMYKRDLFTPEGWSQMRQAHRSFWQTLFFGAGFVAWMILGGTMRHFGL
jgi:hypothetical protein